jgi:hypothetical protein
MGPTEQLKTSGLRLISAYIKLFLLEFKLARQSIVPLIICAVLLIILVASIWGFLLILIGYVISRFVGNLPHVFLFTFIVDFVITLIVALLAMKFVRQMTFPRVRKYFKAHPSITDNMDEE